MPSRKGREAVFTTPFGSGACEGYEKRNDKSNNAVETIQSIWHAKVKKRNSRLLSQLSLAIEIDESDMAREVAFEITVGNPPPGERYPIP